MCFHRTCTEFCGVLSIEILVVGEALACGCLVDTWHGVDTSGVVMSLSAYGIAHEMAV